MIHIERMHWMSETPLSAAQAHRLSQQFGQALEKAMAEMRGARQDWSLGTLSVRLPQHATTNSAFFSQLATQTARQLMQRVSVAGNNAQGNASRGSKPKGSAQEGNAP